MIKGEMAFDVDASLLVQLGEQLVTHNSTALAELIKNAYDADATKVEVVLENVTRPEKEDRVIIIADNGEGMTLDVIKNAWMRIATDFKEKNPVSSICGRPRTGRKGIGRFAARRLADKLTLVSIAIDPTDNIKKRVEAHFNWMGDDFARGKTLSNIKISYSVEVVTNEVETGVTLYLENVKEIWTREDVSSLNRDLVTIINPFGIEEIKIDNSTDDECDKGFQYYLVAEEFPDYEGDLREQFLDVAWAELGGNINNEGIARYTITIRPTGEKLTFTPKDRFHLIPNTEFQIYYLVYTRTDLGDAEFNVRDLQRIGREQGGVRIYQDGFRVFPYGNQELGDDWLRLDIARAQRNTRIIEVEELKEFEKKYGIAALLTPGNNQLFGSVLVSQSQHPNLKITASREGFAENTAFEQLRKFVQIGLWWMTIQYARVTHEDREERRSQRIAKQRQPIPQMINTARQTVKESIQARVGTGVIKPDVGEALEKIIDEEFSDVEEEAKVQEEEKIGEMAMLRILSATGTTVNLVQHQLRAMILGIKGIIYQLRQILPFVSDKEMSTKLENVITESSLWHKYIEQQVSQLGFLMGETAKTERKRIALKPMVDRVFAPYESYTIDKGIRPLNLVEPNIRTPEMFEAELYTVLLHTFTNALKAVRGQSNRVVGIDASANSDEVIIRILDSGIGIYGEDRQAVFRPFKTTTNSSEFDFPWGVGTGLGLWVVKDIVTENNGEINFTDPEPGTDWVTCLEIKLKR